MSNHIDVKVKYISSKMGEQINPPFYATTGSAGMDLAACINEPITIKPGEKTVIPTGIAIQLPSNEYVALIFSRSGLGIKHGITMSNGVGVIDSDYTGEIKCGLVNLGTETYTIQPNDRIAQMVFMPVAIAALTVVNQLDSTERGAGGLGSTGQ
ncbi:dUTP diphosphatase [Petroclostridium sp. X23]|uniref:dUTP diphosphatase n=1 Tax=Petroclostridium sp. X23 TaxID=3045146 RepID=UPI0024AD98AD|nr:dUTP diphosphatase [Petroclostridium sp. X23]WHH61060.1 dUTP diphosphatase [Petroclostridium sp. X23]